MDESRESKGGNHSDVLPFCCALSRGFLVPAVGRRHVGSVGADTGELWAVNKLGRLLGQLGEAGRSGQAVGGDILGSIVMRVREEEGKVMKMSTAIRALFSRQI